MRSLVAVCLLSAAQGCGFTGQPFADPAILGEDELGVISRQLRQGLGGDIRVEEIFPNRGSGRGVQRPVRRASDLTCTDWGPQDCRWTNVPGDRLDWYQGAGSPDNFRLAAANGRSRIEPPKGSYAITASSVRLANPIEGAFLYSPDITCQEGDGRLSFAYWLSPQAQLRVCVQAVGSRTESFCSDPIDRAAPGPAVVTIPGPIRDPFNIVIKAESFTYSSAIFQGGFAMLDDVDYEADLATCTLNPLAQRRGALGSRDGGPAVRRQPSAAPPRLPEPAVKESEPSPPTEELVNDFGFPSDADYYGGGVDVLSEAGSARASEACALLQCTFDGDSCRELIEDAGEWRRAKRVGNPLTGIPGGPSGRSDTFAYAGGPATVLRFQTGPFRLAETTLIAFDYHKASAETQFEVLFKRKGDVEERSLFLAPKVNRDSRRWQREVRQLLAGDYETVVFEARNLAGNAFVGVDEIGLVDRRRNPLC